MSLDERGCVFSWRKLEATANFHQDIAGLSRELRSTQMKCLLDYTYIPNMIGTEGADELVVYLRTKALEIGKVIYVSPLWCTACFVIS